MTVTQAKSHAGYPLAVRQTDMGLIIKGLGSAAQRTGLGKGEGLSERNPHVDNLLIIQRKDRPSPGTDG